MGGAEVRLLAIDPGTTESAYVVIDEECSPMIFGKIDNATLRTKIVRGYDEIEADRVVIEMVASYGMAVGADVFETCVWVGRFAEAVRASWWPHTEPKLITRNPIKLHHCRSGRANDSNITQALVDRFAPGQRNHGKGTKDEPGWFYGFKKDIWQAYALAVYAADVA